ncbi:MAG: transglutaminase domain-containing protein [Oscillospiraceae bacterium]|nr:transglutaminase domain-containing protein [Oscillospiraceae bacterium]
MNNSKVTTMLIALIVTVGLTIGLTVGCEQGQTNQQPQPTGNVVNADAVAMDLTLVTGSLRDSPAMFEMPMPAATGVNVKSNSKAEIDISNIEQGYFMARYTEQTDDLIVVLVDGPTGTTYTYVHNTIGEFEVFPLSDGNGAYTLGVYEQMEGTRFASVLQVTIDVVLDDEFAPFTYPNQYVNYNEHTHAVIVAADLVSSADTTLERISAIYQFVINNITYDRELAATVQAGYLPDLDAILKSGKGICFDYAALMTAMLRSQGVPCKLVIGYTGDDYHAWISVYCYEDGWLTGAIFFDGSNWTIIDPSFDAAASLGSEILARITGGSRNYVAKYLY